MTMKSSHNESRPLHSVQWMSIDAWGEFQVHPIQLVPPVGAISSDVTSQGRQRAVRKIVLAISNTVDSYLMSVATSACNKMHFDFSGNYAGFCSEGHIYEIYCSYLFTLCFCCSSQEF